LGANPSPICARKNEHLVWTDNTPDDVNNTPDDGRVSTPRQHCVAVIGHEVGATEHCRQHKHTSLTTATTTTMTMMMMMMIVCTAP